MIDFDDLNLNLIDFGNFEINEKLKFHAQLSRA